MKKWGFLLFLILVLGFGGAKLVTFFQNKEGVYENHQHLGSSPYDIGTSDVTRNIEIPKDMVYQGNLLLVNKEYQIHQVGVKKDIVNLFEHKELAKGYGLLNTNIYLSEDIAQKFSEMVAAAEIDGVNHFLISSGYRNFHEQSVLYQQVGSDYALPAGNSEHNVGFALDVGSTLMKMENAPEGRWIKENAWKYGFILRYPRDKTDITGIQYEPWHIRYVGLPHSMIIHEKNLALEEYLDYLKKKKEISTTFKGKKYTITYYPVYQKNAIKVRVDHDYSISGNNMDGVIVTEIE